MERRKFCQLTGLAVASASLPLATGCSRVPAGSIDAGKASLYVTDDAIPVQVPGFNFYVCHDAGGLYAMSANCTHAHCFLQFNGAQVGFQCPCHDSTFDYNGQNNTPPAPGPLQHFQVIVDGGELFIDPNQPVDPTTRTPV
jgi:Rieske Fe-S protein